MNILGLCNNLKKLDQSQKQKIDGLTSKSFYCIFSSDCSIKIVVAKNCSILSIRNSSKRHIEKEKCTINKSDYVN